MGRKRVYTALFLIMFFGLSFRLWGLGSAELVFDEGLDAFRSIGYLDYLESPVQTTPVQWLAETNFPWWANLSFHDHPFLFFFIQHVFFLVGGDSLFVARLPSALAGAASIFLFYLIAENIFFRLGFIKKRESGFFRGASENQLSGLLAAGLASVNLTLVLSSRLSMQEGLLFFLILLNSYFFLRFLENKKYWLGFGLTLGLTFMVKYTSFYLLPAYLVFLLIARREFLRNPRLYLSLLISAVVFLPVAIYNLFLYQNFGHFDLQFLYLFKQQTPHWRPDFWGGKAQEPFASIWPNLRVIFSLPFLLFSAIGLVLSVFWSKIKKSDYAKDARIAWFWPVSFLFMTIMFLVAGSAVRFVSFYALPGVFFAVLVFMHFGSRFSGRAILTIFLLLLGYELYFSTNTIFTNAPDYGVVKLDKYFDQVLGSGRSEALAYSTNPHLNRVIQQYASSRPVTLVPTGLIYDDNIATPAELWLFSRRRYYHGLPAMKISEFEKYVSENQTEMFRGFKLYLVEAGPDAPLNPTGQVTYLDSWKKLLENLSRRNPPLVITGQENLPAFTIYQVDFK